ncbi:DNA methylase [Mycolicibacterium peregrinum]|uniref:BREX-2 system adenine-specific DNA-methyltransferase PglX n=1 Tax=Mycolicibacterium peregrinum TaxID=43304 RepID=UPI0007EAA45B|nr:BREX-2 system adenine-specific DNA-methyltransferase PglX [Mycolicibacterium peregrinum]OBF38942.1 DNA methylase [Mycolicibacterium peregrinum]
MRLATIAGGALTAELRPQLGLLVDDMRERLNADAAVVDRWRQQHREAVSQELTAGSFTDWVDDQLTQAAVGWLLTSVFVRFCEDNLLLGESGVWITHVDVRLRQRALDTENAFYQADPDRSYREWLEKAFSALRANRATAPLVDEHAAIGIISPSSDAVHTVLSFWRRTDDDGNLLWRFDDVELSTRFLGDLYQDLSEYAKKKYALLQTPVFVEEFILEQTLIPALAERPLEGFKVIDPTCGSGHFLLGAFEILVDRWHREAPGLEVRARVNKALESVYGVDVNPFATAIAMFRLIVAALKQTGDRSLLNAPAFTLNLASGDSLLHGPDALGRTGFDYGDESFDKDAVASRFSYRTEDVPKLRRFLSAGQYDVVVGNPPYITVKDKALKDRYREIYHYCKGQYVLTVPFMERFFQLAKSGQQSGWVGQITSNSFMKREFGASIIVDFLARKDLRLIVDSSGAHIPGHGTPTVIIVGRNDARAHEMVRAVLGVQGELGIPDNPSRGKVWSSVVEHVDEPGYQDQWITVVDLPRTRLDQHPWSLAGGGAIELKVAIETSSCRRLKNWVTDIGFVAVTREDDAYELGLATLRRLNVRQDLQRDIVGGLDLRDWTFGDSNVGLCTYDSSGKPAIDEPAFRSLWQCRTLLRIRRALSGTQDEQGLEWWEYSQINLRRFTSTMLIVYAEVATNNHFVLSRGGKVCKQTAPVIRLPENATTDDYLRLLCVLNSSAASFWLKQSCHNKGEGGGARVEAGYAALGSETWKNTYQFNANRLAEFPLPDLVSADRAEAIDKLVARLRELDPAAVVASRGATATAIAGAHSENDSSRGLLLAEQEELDWEVYRRYGLIDEDMFMSVGESPRIALGERAFEVALARRVEAGEIDTEWFSRHGVTPVTDVSPHWPANYKALIERRLEVIESNPFINLLERPEYKRRWTGESWEVKLQRALRDWLLDKLENPSLWFTAQGTPQPLSVGELAGHVEKDSEFITALDMWAGQKDAPVTSSLEKLLSEQVVPYLAALRYKASGLRKRAEWERVWSLQRDEDAGLIKATDIPVPPKYTSVDFLKQSYWSNRGKLDVAKERFVVYPGAGRATDPTPLLGWAGWNHAQQGIALATIYAQREAEGTALSELVPVVAGIAEVLPWVKQWHSGVDPVFNIDLAEYLAAQLAEKSAAVGVPVSDLPNWQPPTTPTRRKKK